MTERVAQRLRQMLRERPDIEIRFTDGNTPDSYHLGPAILFLHPTHQRLVDQLRGRSVE